MFQMNEDRWGWGGRWGDEGGGALIQLCASITQAGRDEEEEEEVLKFRVELSNFLFCCGLISCFEKKCNIPHSWSQTIILPGSVRLKVVSTKKEKTNRRMLISCNCVSQNSSRLEWNFDQSDWSCSTRCCNIFARVSLERGRKVSREICTSTT